MRFAISRRVFSGSFVPTSDLVWPADFAAVELCVSAGFAKLIVELCSLDRTRQPFQAYACMHRAYELVVAKRNPLASWKKQYDSWYQEAGTQTT
jgi:hypothetical protein